jgi:multiple sugar transport system substrate-binding protein
MPKRTSSEGISRREFLSRGLKTGVSLAALGTLSSCGITGQRQGGGGGGGGASQISIAINDSPWLASFEEIANVYQEETGTTVNLRVFPYEGLLSKELNASDNKSDEFDIYNINTPWTAKFYDGGLVTPFEEVDSSFEWSSEVIEYKNMGRWDKQKSYFAEDAPAYALPINGNIQLFYYRRDLYEQMDLEPPTTWDEAIAAAKKVKQVNSDVYGYLIRGSDDPGYNFMPLLRGSGGSILANPPEDWSVVINSDEAQQAIELYMELASYGPANPHSIGQADMIALMQSGRALQNHMVVASHDEVDDEAQSQVAGEIGFGVIPKPQNGNHATTIGAWFMGIPSHISETKKKAAYDFLTWLMTKDAQMQYGRAEGIVTRQDVYEALADEGKFRWMKAVADSTPYLEHYADYTFGAEVIEIVNLRLNQILAGQLKPKAGLDRMASEISRVVENAGH